ncbi:hypothetical protein BGZ92_003527, partial [Podila epicladia]
MSAENHAKIYKADLELISANIDIPAPLRKVSASLVKNFKHDLFVNKFAKLTDILAERNANYGMRNMFLKVAGNLGTGNGDHLHQTKGHQSKEMETDAALESNVEEAETDVDLESDVEETETDAALEGDVEEVEVVALPSVLGKRTRARLVNVSTLRPTLQDPYQDPAMKSRVNRFEQMDQTKFWKLVSGRTVEQILFEKSIKGGASYKIRSYTIDYACGITKKLFTDEEWTEVLSYNEWELPELEEATWNYLDSVCTTLQKASTLQSYPFLLTIRPPAT